MKIEKCNCAMSLLTSDKPIHMLTKCAVIEIMQRKAQRAKEIVTNRNKETKGLTKHQKSV